MLDNLQINTAINIVTFDDSKPDNSTQDGASDSSFPTAHACMNIQSILLRMPSRSMK
ncbi:hypothetical protein BSIN_4458 [Burkholderia singularis]|uniref:Uncharacterized protein n=1 Tax=Burkholderia singularis TaxID=1503053 RepID=A0A238H8B4_9BURK|nr:hypothetical protein BSIN_4458 [Burkholderia singularis]